MKAIWFKEFRLYTSFDRALWCALIWPFILALNPLFLEAGESLSTAMIDAPGFALLFSLCVDYTTYDDYRSGVFELIVQAGLPLREYLTAKLWFYEAVSSAFLLVSLVAGLAVDHWQPSDMPVTVMQLFMAFVLNGAWAALGTQLAICLRLLNPDSALYLTPLALALPVRQCRPVASRGSGARPDGLVHRGRIMRRGRFRHHGARAPWQVHPDLAVGCGTIRPWDGVGGYVRRGGTCHVRVRQAPNRAG